MKKFNLGRTLVEFLVIGIIATMLGLGAFGYKPVHSNAATLPAGTVLPVPLLLSPNIQGGTINASSINVSGGTLNNATINNASFVPALGPYVSSTSCSTSANPLLTCSVTNSTTAPDVDFELTAGANTLLGNNTGSSGYPTAISVPSCSGTGSALNWTTSTGLSCNTALTVAAPTGSGASGTNVPYTIAIGIDPVVVAEYYYASSVASGVTQGDVMIGSAVPQTVTLSGTCTAASTSCVATVGNSTSTFATTDIPSVATTMAKVITVWDATNSRYASMYINTYTNAYTSTFTVGANAIATGAYTANNWTYGWPMAYAYPNAWLELPANTLSSSVTGYGTAQLWYATCSLTTLCQVTTTSVLPGGTTYFTPNIAARPGSPVNAVGGATATSISTGTNYRFANIKVPANTLGMNGRVKMNASWSNSGSPANKTPSTSYLSWVFWQQNVAATTEFYSSFMSFQNRGAINSQMNLTAPYSSGFGGSQNTAYTGTYGLTNTVDSTMDEPLYLSGAIATTSANGDVLVLEGFNVEIWPHN